MADALRKTIQSPPGSFICAGLLASAVLLPVAVKAQTRTPPTPAVVMGDPTRRDVRVGADVPNISGVWVALTSNRSTPPYDGGATPFLPWAQAYFDRRGEAERNGQPLFDPNANCLPGGVPRIISSPYPIDITQTPTLTMISTETLHEARMIHMDGKPMPADFKPSYFGYSVGHWEGDALVVETTGLSPYTQVDEEGRPKSKDMKVVERYQKHAPNLLEVTYTLYDPRTYSRPWTVQARFRWAPEMSLGEYICEENNRNKPDATGKLRHGSEKK
ncbi:MAG: hypothetical protein ACXU82_00875 [Caulobacteraceae bacterium]